MCPAAGSVPSSSGAGCWQSRGCSAHCYSAGHPTSCGVFCGHLGEHQLLFLATGHPVQEPHACLSNWAAVLPEKASPCQEPGQPLGWLVSHLMGLKVQVTLNEMCSKRTSSLGPLLPAHRQPACWVLPCSQLLHPSLLHRAGSL